MKAGGTQHGGADAVEPAVAFANQGWLAKVQVVRHRVRTGEREDIDGEVAFFHQGHVLVISHVRHSFHPGVGKLAREVVQESRVALVQDRSIAGEDPQLDPVLALLEGVVDRLQTSPVNLLAVPGAVHQNLGTALDAALGHIAGRFVHGAVAGQ